MLFDWANQPFQTLIVTFVFAPYFAREVVGDPVARPGALGHRRRDRRRHRRGPRPAARRHRRPHRRPQALGARLLGALSRSAASASGSRRPACPTRRSVLAAYVLAFLGSEFGTVFTNAMLPGLAPRREIGRISGSGWALGYLGGLVSLVLVLLLLVPAPGGTLTLARHPADPRARRRRRRAGARHRAALGALVPGLRRCRSSSSPPTRRPAAPAARSRAGARRPRRDLPARARGTAASSPSSAPRCSTATRWPRSSPSAASTPPACSAGACSSSGSSASSPPAIGAVGAWVGGRADRAFGPRPVIVASLWVLIAVCAVAAPHHPRQRARLRRARRARGCPTTSSWLARRRCSAPPAARCRRPRARSSSTRPRAGWRRPRPSASSRSRAGPPPSSARRLIAAVTAATGSQRLGVSPVILLFLARPRAAILGQNRQRAARDPTA